MLMGFESSDQRLLDLMRKGYDRELAKEVISTAQAVDPDLVSVAMFVVGHPKETEDDFQRMLRLIEDVGYDSSFSFVFSKRPGTPAAALPDETPQALKLQRLQALQALLEQNVRRISASRVGTVQRILVEGPSKKNPLEFMGRTECNRIVNFDAGPGGAARLQGRMIDVFITEALPHSLRGAPVTTDTVLSAAPARTPATTA